jgi:uncharacterized protein (UPF0335 family)
MENEKLKTYVERIERLEEERAALAADIKDIYTEVKSTGFDAKVLKKIIAIRKKGQKEHDEEQQMIALYMKELGMLADTPLGKAAIDAQLKESGQWKNLK